MACFLFSRANFRTVPFSSTQLPLTRYSPSRPCSSNFRRSLARARSCAGYGLPGYLGFGAHILAGHIVALRALFGAHAKDQQTQAGDIITLIENAFAASMPRNLPLALG